MNGVMIMKRSALLCLFLVAILFSGCSKPENTCSEKKTTVAIISALQSEMKSLKAEITNCQTENVANKEVCVGEIGDYNVILMECGMGKVSAAAGAQALITKFNPDYVINTGCAGAISKELNIGDIVISEKTVEWDLDLISLGYPRGYVSSLDRVEMTADAELSQMIRKAIPDDTRVFTGCVVSGDQFVDKEEQLEVIVDAFPDALCAEMEGAAIGHVCVENGIPFCVIRAMSDTADHSSSMNFAEFSAAAGKKSAETLISMLKNADY